MYSDPTEKITVLKLLKSTVNIGPNTRLSEQSTSLFIVFGTAQPQRTQAVHADPYLSITYFLMAVASFSRMMSPVTTKMAEVWFEEHSNEFEVLTWLPCSREFNPIEHLWDVLKN